MIYKCKHFGIKELVSRKVYNAFIKYGEAFIWGFFDAEILQDVDLIRETWGKPIIINDWAFGGSLEQCGLRSNIEQLTKDHTAKGVPYLGGHNLAKGFDFHDKAGDNKGLYEHICNLARQGRLKKLRRVENIASTPTWVHADGLQIVADKLQIFYV